MLDSIIRCGLLRAGAAAVDQRLSFDWEVELAGPNRIIQGPGLFAVDEKT